MPEKTKPKDKVDIYQDINQLIDKYGVSSDELYNKISEDPQSFTNYWNALRLRNEGESTPEMREFLSNINKRFSPEFGAVYDPTSKGGLRPIPKEDPRYKSILDYSNKYPSGKNDNRNTLADDSKFSNIILGDSSQQHHYGDASYGFGNENSPEYNWWKTNGKKAIEENPQHKVLLENYPPQQKPITNGAQTRTLSKVTSAYDPSDRTVIDGKVVFKDPGWTFSKEYDDGSKENIDENTYQTMKTFNTLPGHIKNKYIEESPLKEEDKSGQITYSNDKRKF